METPIISNNPSRAMLRFHGAMLPVLSGEWLIALLLLDVLPIRIPFILVVAIAVSLIFWNVTYLSAYARQAARMRSVQLAALASIPAFLMSEKIFFSWHAVRRAIMNEHMHMGISVIGTPVLSVIFLGFIGWAAWTFWKTKTEEGFRAFLFVWFWTSPFSSIALGMGLCLMGISPVGSIGDAPCARHPIRCAVAAFAISALVLVIAWWAWRLIRRARQTMPTGQAGPHSSST